MLIRLVYILLNLFFTCNTYFEYLVCTCLHYSDTHTHTRHFLRQTNCFTACFLNLKKYMVDPFPSIYIYGSLILFKDYIIFYSITTS